MYIDKLTLARAARSGKCDHCKQRVSHRGRAVLIRLVFRLMPGEDWQTIAICKKCLDTWHRLLQPKKPARS